MADEIRRFFPEDRAEIKVLPLADGGEGTAALLFRYLGGKTEHITVRGPLGKAHRAWMGYNEADGTAYLEMASAAGLELVPLQSRNPLVTTTYGVGELIRRAVDLGAKKLYIGMGGSATVDCGTGMAQALGARFYDRSDRIIDASRGGGVLKDIKSMELSDMPQALQKMEIIALSDVRTLLKDCVKTFAPQKGADTREHLDILQQGVGNIYSLAQKAEGPDDFPGAGAAGGLGYGCRFFLKAAIKPGATVIFKLNSFKENAAWADYIITGEGTLDAQSFEGKTIGSLLAFLAGNNLHVPVVIICGQAKDLSLLRRQQNKYPFMVCPIINELSQNNMEPAIAEENLRFNMANLMHFIQNKVE